MGRPGKPYGMYRRENNAMSRYARSEIEQICDKQRADFVDARTQLCDLFVSRAASIEIGLAEYNTWTKTIPDSVFLGRYPAMTKHYQAKIAELS